MGRVSQLRKPLFSRLPRRFLPSKAGALPTSWLDGGVAGGVLDHGTREEDGPGTWEAHVSPRQAPAQRDAGDQIPKDGVRVDACVVDENVIHVEVGRQQARAEPRPKEQGSRRAAYER